MKYYYYRGCNSILEHVFKISSKKDLLGGGFREWYSRRRITKGIDRYDWKEVSKEERKIKPINPKLGKLLFSKDKVTRQIGFELLHEKLNKGESLWKM